MELLNQPLKLLLSDVGGDAELTILTNESLVFANVFGVFDDDYMKEMKELLDKTEIDTMKDYEQLKDIGGSLSKAIILTLGDNGIETLKGMPILSQLQKLYLWGNRITNMANLQPLAQFPNLIELNLDNNGIETLEGMPILPHLQKLSLWDNIISNMANIQPLVPTRPIGTVQFPNLIELALSRNGIETLIGMPTLPHLQKLKLLGNRISNMANLQLLAQFPNLIELNLDNNGIETLTGMPILPHLQKLTLWRNRISNMANIQPLVQLPNLVELDLSRNGIETLIGIPVLPHLQKLSLLGNRIINMANLQPLVLTSPTEMVQSPQLVELDLSGNGIETLEGMPILFHLQKLDLWGNRIINMANLQPLIQFPQLVELDLGENDIETLEGMPILLHLQKLDLGDNEITEQDVPEYYRNKPNLEIII